MTMRHLGADELWGLERRYRALCLHRASTLKAVKRELEDQHRLLMLRRFRLGSSARTAPELPGPTPSPRSARPGHAAYAAHLPRRAAAGVRIRSDSDEGPLAFPARPAGQGATVAGGSRGGGAPTLRQDSDVVRMAIHSRQASGDTAVPAAAGGCDSEPAAGRPGGLPAASAWAREAARGAVIKEMAGIRARLGAALALLDQRAGTGRAGPGCARDGGAPSCNAACAEY